MGGLSRATFAKLSPHPYLLANLEPASEDIVPARSNGRSPETARRPIVNLSSLSHAHGSALVRTGDTTVICGVRGETILTSNIPSYRASNFDTELKEYDLLVPNIELATGAAPQFLPGGPPTTLAQTLSTRIYSLLHSCKLVGPECMRIWHTRQTEEFRNGEDRMEGDDVDGDSDAGAEGCEKSVVAYWVLYIDLFFISFDGNPFDAAWAATIAALKNTKLPRARYDHDRELVVCSAEESLPLHIRGTPIAVTAVVFTSKETDRPDDGKHWLLLDPDSLEESLCEESVTIVVDFHGPAMRICSVSKHGGTTLTPALLESAEFLGRAKDRWEVFTRAIASKD